LYVPCWFTLKVGDEPLTGLPFLVQAKVLPLAAETLESKTVDCPAQTPLSGPKFGFEIGHNVAAFESIADNKEY